MKRHYKTLLLLTSATLCGVYAQQSAQSPVTSAPVEAAVAAPLDTTAMYDSAIALFDKVRTVETTQPVDDAGCARHCGTQLAAILRHEGNIAQPRPES